MGTSSSDFAAASFGIGNAARLSELPTTSKLLSPIAIAASDTLMLTIPSQLGVEFNLRVIESFAKYVAPALGWRSTRA